MYILAHIKSLLSITIVIPLIFCVGIYLSIRLKWLQFAHLSLGVKYIFQKNKTQLTFSSFTALAAVLGGNLGTGNIAGIAVALSTGGPGALFWMWVMALFGAIVKFTGCYLGVKYQQKLPFYGWVGGPMYYLENGLGLKKTAKFFCIFTLCSALTVGNLVQVNSIALPLNAAGVPAIITGTVIAMLLAIVLIGGKRSFALVASRTVPIMAVIYLFASFIILIIFKDKIISSLYLIFYSAFNFASVTGGALGLTVIDAICVGFDRGLFATDAGVGLAPILHAQVGSNDDERPDNAFVQGMIGIIAPIIVMLICMITGTVLLVTGAWQIQDMESTNVCIKAFQIGLGHRYASYIVILTLFLFAFTTILTWEHCAEKAMVYLTNKKAVLMFKWFFVIIIPIGAGCSVRFVWSLADIVLNIMLIINMIGVIGLSKEVILGVRDRFLT